MKKILVIILLGFVALSSQGCSSKKSVTTETITEESVPSTEVTASQAQNKKVTMIEKKTEVKEEGPYCRGILSCTLEVTGDIIALPFRLVGGLIDLIF
jgi:type IV pilus biogenesis protein CpaD/CtpE